MSRLPRLAAAFVVLTAACYVADPAAQAPSPKPLVFVLSTGGTISGKGASSTSLAEYKSGALLGEELVAAVPEIKDVADVRVEQIANVSSTDITVAHWLTLANRINQIFETEPRASGVVITHGTNTIEETAYFLNLTVKHDLPVVLVGAMRPASAISADGPLNLLNGIRTAVSKDAVGKGALVVLNEEVNGARDVQKTNTYRVETFRAPELGLLGYVDADQVAFYRASLKRHTARSEFDVRGRTSLPAVEILYSYVQPSTVLASALAASGVQGIVFAGTGAGLISTAERASLKPLLEAPAATRPVLVRSNRTGNGRVVALADYDAIGMIPGDNLTPQKARILLMLGLTKTRELAELRRMFAEYRGAVRRAAGILDPKLVPRPSSRILPGIYAGFATVALTVIVTAVFVGAQTTARGTVVAAGLGSGAFGFFTVARGLAGPVAGALQFARPWLWFTVWAAVGLYDGRYQPMVASAVLTVGMALCYLVGGGIAAFRQRP